MNYGVLNPLVKIYKILLILFWHNFVEEANSVFKCFETHPYTHRTPWAGANFYSFTSFSDCMFKTAIYICSFGCRRTWTRAWFGGAVCETQLSACAPNTVREYNFFRVLCLNALNSFECLNWQGLKICANDNLSWRRPAVARQLSWASF